MPSDAFTRRTLLALGGAPLSQFKHMVARDQLPFPDPYAVSGDLYDAAEAAGEDEADPRTYAVYTLGDAVRLDLRNRMIRRGIANAATASTMLRNLDEDAWNWLGSREAWLPAALTGNLFYVERLRIDAGEVLPHGRALSRDLAEIADWLVEPGEEDDDNIFGGVVANIAPSAEAVLDRAHRAGIATPYDTLRGAPEVAR